MTVKISVENAPEATELFRFGEGWLYCLDAHPTEALLAVCRGDAAWIYDAATLEVVTKLLGHTGWVMDLEWSPDGSQLVSSGGDGTIRIWEAETYAEVLAIDAHDGPFPDVDWNPDGTLLRSASHDTTAAAWYPITGEQKVSIPIENEVSHVSWSGYRQSGTLGTYNIGKTFSWDPETNEISLQNLSAPQVPAAVAECYKESGGATGFYDGMIGIGFSKGENDPDWYIGNYQHSDAIYALDFNSSCDTLAFGSYETLQLWSRETKDVSLVINRETADFTGISWLAGDNQIAVIGENFLAIYDAVTGEIVREVKDDSTYFRQVEWSPDGKYLAAAAAIDGTIRIWDFESRELVQVLEGHDIGVWGVSWSPDGSRLATCNQDAEDPTIRIWDTETWQELHLLEGHTEGVRDIIWSPDGTQLVSSGKDQIIVIWDAQSGEKLDTIISANYINQLDWSPEGARFASANGDGSVRFWDPGTGRQTNFITAHGVSIAVEYSPDGTLIASGGGDGQIKIWEVATKEQTLLLKGDGNVWTITWSPDGSLLLSVDAYGNIRLWEASSGELLYEAKGFTWALFAAWSPNGKYFAVANTAGIIHIYGVAAAGE